MGFGECAESDSLGFSHLPTQRTWAQYASSLSLLSGDQMGDTSEELATVLATW